MHPLQAGVDTESAGGRELVGGVAAQHDATLHEPLGDCDVHPPATDAENVDAELVDPDRGADPPLDALTGEHVRGPLLGRHRDLTQPAALGVEGLQHAAGLRVGDEQKHARSVRDVGLDVRAEVAVDEVVEVLIALEGDPEKPRDRPTWNACWLASQPVGMIAASPTGGPR